jgi:hypothetical protein
MRVRTGRFDELWSRGQPMDTQLIEIAPKYSFSFLADRASSLPPRDADFIRMLKGEFSFPQDI